MDDSYCQKSVGETVMLNDPAGSDQQQCIKSEKGMDQAKQENVTLPAENATGSKSGKPKINGVSLTELFTPDQVRQHIIGLRQWVGQMLNYLLVCPCHLVPYDVYQSMATQWNGNARGWSNRWERREMVESSLQTSQRS